VIGPLGLAGLGASLAINAYRTLKSLSFSVPLGGDYDPFCGISRELRFIAGNNILEKLELYVEIEPEDDASFLTESEDWSAFDSVLTESGAFPMLHRVLVEIDLDDPDGVESLKEDKFPRLVESKTVEFDIYVYRDVSVDESLL
jgi:hypothetical protein